MKLMVKDDISPCIVKDPATNIGIPLVPGTVLDLRQVGVVDTDGFLKQNGWAFTDSSGVEEATAKPGQKRNVKRDS